MKIKIKESQLKKVLKEVGGYDSGDIMGIHAGSIHGEITRIIVQTADFIKHFTDNLVERSLSKDEMMAGVINLSEKIQEDIQRLSQLSKEIYIDDDFKFLMISYIRTLKKVLKYFKLLSNVSPGIIGGQPNIFGGGLGIDMGEDELALEIAKKLSILGNYLQDLGDMFQTIIDRYSSRFEGGN